MALRFDSRWRHHPPSDGELFRCTIPSSSISEFLGMVLRVSTQGDEQPIYEHFKKFFCALNNVPHYSSSSTGWAETDLRSQMEQAASNAPLFIEAFFDACESLRKKRKGWFVPDSVVLNHLLEKHKIAYEIVPPELRLRSTSEPLIAVVEPTPTLTDDARSILQTSVSRSEELLAEGRHREAIQELLWLLETVVTAFRGVELAAGTVDGTYFNQIVRDLRTKSTGATLERALTWMTQLHGYLSSPTGGGIRHGTDIREAILLSPHEGRLIANLIRSYLAYLIAEHAVIEGKLPPNS